MFGFDGRERELKCSATFLCAARVFVVVVVVLFVSEGRSGNHVLQEVKLDGLSSTPQLLNLPLTVLSFGIKV